MFSCKNKNKRNMSSILNPMNCMFIILCGKTTNAHTFSYCLPLQAFPQKPQSRNPYECAYCVFCVSPGNRLRADIFSIHLLTACTFGRQKCPFVLVNNGRSVCLQPTLCDIFNSGRKLTRAPVTCACEEN